MARERMRFNDWLSLAKDSGAPEDMIEAMVHVHDTLDTADVIAHSIFVRQEYRDDECELFKEVPDELVLAVYDRLVGHERYMRSQEDERFVDQMEYARHEFRAQQDDGEHDD